GLELPLDAGHRGGEVLGPARPARRIDPGLAAERLDAEARIVGERGLAGRPRRGLRLDRGVVAKGLSRLLRLDEVQFRGADRLDAVGRKQLPDLAELAGV